MKFDELYWGVPMDLHVWKPKVAAKFAAYPEFVADCDALADLRAAIKVAPVEPKPVREDHPLLVLARKEPESFVDLNRRLQGEYRDALDLGRTLRDRKGAPLEGLPVNVHRVFCANYGGTTWVRLDWFLSGRRVAFSVIAAAYDALVREGVIVEVEA